MAAITLINNAPYELAQSGEPVVNAARGTVGNFLRFMEDGADKPLTTIGVVAGGRQKVGSYTLAFSQGKFPHPMLYFYDADVASLKLEAVAERRDAPDAQGREFTPVFQATLTYRNGEAEVLTLPIPKLFSELAKARKENRAPDMARLFTVTSIPVVTVTVQQGDTPSPTKPRRRRGGMPTPQGTGTGPAAEPVNTAMAAALAAAGVVVPTAGEHPADAAASGDGTA